MKKKKKKYDRKKKVRLEQHTCRLTCDDDDGVRIQSAFLVCFMSFFFFCFAYIFFSLSLSSLRLPASSLHLYTSTLPSLVAHSYSHFFSCSHRRVRASEREKKKERTRERESKLSGITYRKCALVFFFCAFATRPYGRWTSSDKSTAITILQTKESNKEERKERRQKIEMACLHNHI